MLQAIPPVTLRIQVGNDVVRVEVVDGSAELPRARAFSATAATGRGLRLLETLVARWGIRTVPRGGKVVWFEVGPDSESDNAASFAGTRP